jgi:hypothetical protein
MEVVMMHEGLQSCGGTYRKKKMRKNIASGVEILEDSYPGSNVLVLVVFVRPRATARTCTTVVYRAALVLREGRSRLHTARLILCFNSTI